MPSRLPPKRISLARIGFLRRRFAVDQIGRGFGQRLVRVAGAGVFGVLLFERGDFFARRGT